MALRASPSVRRNAQWALSCNQSFGIPWSPSTGRGVVLQRNAACDGRCGVGSRPIYWNAVLLQQSIGTFMKSRPENHVWGVPVGWDGVIDSTFWPRRRLQKSDQILLDECKAWLLTLPVGVRPRYLPVQFPRIVNEIFHLWHDPIALERYLIDKFVQHRENWQGFSPLIREELLAMDMYSVLPNVACSWRFGTAPGPSAIHSGTSRQSAAMPLGER
jgi:hypothetical protein